MSFAAGSCSEPAGLWFVIPSPCSEAAAGAAPTMERRPPRRRLRGAMHAGGAEHQKPHRRPHGTGACGQGPPPSPPGYFTAELVLAFLFVAVSLAILPLVLPPLAPPPALLLLVPVGLLAVLVALAFVPLDAHSHLAGAAR